MTPDQMQKICDAATPGEWVFHDQETDAEPWGTFSIQDKSISTGFFISDADCVDGTKEGSLILTKDTAKFIATFHPPTVNKLLKVVKRCHEWHNAKLFDRDVAEARMSEALKELENEHT